MAEASEHVSLKFAFEVDSFAKLNKSKPFKLIPIGVWYRGERKMEITRERLAEIARNFAEGLPRFRVPINLDHEQDGGKVGNITKVKYLDDGPDGAGLYVTDYELTEKGLEAIEEHGYDAVSAELVWSIGGGKYQDPKSGKSFDNVLVGVGLTPKPFFGHREVALYSADMPEEYCGTRRNYGGAVTFQEYDMFVGEMEEESRVGNLQSVYRDLFENIWDSEIPIDVRGEMVNALTSEFKSRVVKGSDMSIIDSVKIFLSDGTTEEVTELTPIVEESEELHEEIVTTEENVMEETVDENVVTLETEEFDTLKAKADAYEANQAEIDKMKAEEQEKVLREKAESFEALPVVVDEFVDKMGALEKESPEAAAWIMEQFAAFDVAMVEAGTLEEIGTDIEGTEDTKDAFLQAVEASVKNDFDGDRGKYSEALARVSAEHPELVAGYTA